MSKVFPISLFENQTITVSVHAIYGEAPASSKIVPTSGHAIQNIQLAEMNPAQDIPIWHLNDGDGTVRMVVGEGGMTAKFIPLKPTAPEPRMPATGYVQIGPIKSDFSVTIKAVPLFTAMMQQPVVVPVVHPKEVILSVGPPVAK